MSSTPKDIFISYTEDDKESAAKLREILRDYLGDKIWMRDFDLNGGDLIINVLNAAIGETKWLIILLSKSALSSKWIRVEANFGTIRALENEDIRIIVVQLEKCEYPPHLEIALKTARRVYMLDLSAQIDQQEEGFLGVAEYIDKAEEDVFPYYGVYEGRGADADKVSLTAKRNNIIFVLGWRGMGKTAFVTNSIPIILKKRILTVNLTVGFSFDMLARQILKVTHVEQPIGKELSDDELFNMAMDALSKRADKFFLFMDNAQNGLDGSNRLLPYLDKFLLKVKDTGINTHVILATTRNPNYGVEISVVRPKSWTVSKVH